MPDAYACLLGFMHSPLAKGAAELLRRAARSCSGGRGSCWRSLLLRAEFALCISVRLLAPRAC